ncbi:hypothetical protein LVB87_00735 [Lysobacter sp. KIS68-7]|uniref:DUF6714 family protein n=1 Tax=Lysobacter sp. KIS68-7 TaxID=2904252 RepID=UPI001E4BBE9B|nr:DUF6714 family protein [Lysobacter sp. KIS68-7]UHQ19729.1 hypothetical protein LVB87_00735 [Lysobacter sp. KIS68-7]
MEDAAKRATRRIIESAFDGVPRASTSLRQFLLTDEKGMSGTITDEEWRIAGITRTDAKWQDLAGLEVEHFGCLLAHMQAEEYRYYLPAYMLYALEHAQASILETAVPGCVVFALRPSRDYPAYSASQYSLLDAPQREAVAAFLRYMAIHAEEFTSGDAERALEFWALPRIGT